MSTLEDPDDHAHRRRFKWRVGRILMRALQEGLEVIATMLYREIFKRNTLMPMTKIITEPNREAKRTLLREWAQTKANESSYIQLAGGFLFTSIASCLQWPGTAHGHWSASALFYSSILFALIAIVTGSQQMLVLPTERQPIYDTEDKGSFSEQLPAVSLQTITRHESQLTKAEKDYLDNIIDRISTHRKVDYPNSLHIFALQTPMMLLSLSVVSFFGGLAAVVFAPLGRNLVWDDNAKIATLVGSVGLICGLVFLSTSFMMHGLFSLQRDPASPISAFLVRIRA